MLVWTHAHLTGAINIFETYFILLVWKTYHETLDSYHLSISDDKYDCIEISLHLKNIDVIKKILYANRGPHFKTCQFKYSTSKIINW